MEIKNRQTLLLVGAGAALLLLVSDSLIFTPLGKSWTERNKRIAEKKEQIRDGRYTLAREDYIHSTWDQMRTNTLPATVSEAEAEMLKAVNGWARTSGVTPVQIRPQWRESGEDYMTYECHADYTGDIRSISRFLYELENDPISCKLDSVEISSRDENGRQLSLGVQISGLVLTAQEQQ